MATAKESCEKALLKLLKIEGVDKNEIVPHKDGLLLKKVGAKTTYQEISKTHRKSLDKLSK